MTAIQEIEVPEGAKFISNSEVDTVNTCERKHVFAFRYNKEPKRPSRSLGIGIIGHEILAVYYKVIMEGGSKATAEQEAFRYLTGLYASMEHDPEVLSVVHALISRYISQDELPNYTRILSVEEDFYMPINDEFWYSMRLDLLVEGIKGKQKGKIILIDHKFTYDFYTVDDLLLNPQMPKYVPTLRANGWDVHEAFINQIRTRFKAHLIPGKPDIDLFQRSPVGITRERIKSALKQQLIVSDRIIQSSKLPLEMQLEEAVPILNRFVCRNCPFKLPCQMMNEGRDWEAVLRTSYKDRSYGYSKEEQQ